MQNRFTVIFNNLIKDESVDLDVPSDITGAELVAALNETYGLGMNMANPKECYLKAENPFVLIRGNKLLSELGLRNGTEINYTN